MNKIKAHAKAQALGVYTDNYGVVVAAFTVR